MVVKVSPVNRQHFASSTGPLGHQTNLCVEQKKILLLPYTKMCQFDSD